MTTDIRFIVLYEENSSSPHTLKSVILGVGFNHKGHTHTDLLELYSPERKVHSARAGERVYAGYLHVDESGNICIYESGGSSTLGIEKDEAEDNAFVQAVEEFPKLKATIGELYPLLSTGRIANVQVSAHQKVTSP